MPDHPRFFYFLSRSEKPLSSKNPIWKKPLPLTREALKTPSLLTFDKEFCYGDYFETAKQFIQNKNYDVLKRAIRIQIKRSVITKDIKDICIYLEKHGEFYHPSRILVDIDGNSLFFVLNMAVSDTGNAYIQNEYQQMKRLTRKFPYDYLPRVYGKGRIQNKENKNIGMYLGQWFEGFNEFHLSIDEKSGEMKMKVWGETGEKIPLSEEQVLQLYVQASYILTLYYNAVTFENISFWHHAAGDFIIRIEKETIELKLITVRRYESIFKIKHQKEFPLPNTQNILNALLIFLLTLLIRMRLDRRDGIGEVLWADDVAVYGTLTGFLKALALKPEPSGLPDSLNTCFKYYLSSCTSTDLLDLSNQIVHKLLSKTPEFFIVQKQLKNHVRVLLKAIHQNI